MERLKFRIVGTSPLIMHNGALADPLHPVSRKIKEISSKRKKVDADHLEMSRLEWYGGLYLKDGKPCIPAAVLEGALMGKGGAARKVKMGKQAAAALFVDGDAPLEHAGPSSLDDLWNGGDGDFVLRAKVNVESRSVIRTRPKFDTWAAEFIISYDPDFLNREHIEKWVHVAGDQVGLMDWRPRHGRFRVEWVEEL